MRAFGTQGILDGQETGQRAVDGQIEQRTPHTGLGIDLRFQGRKVDALVALDVVAAAHTHGLAVQGGGDAVGHHIFHLGVLLFVLQPFFLGAADHGPGHRMGEVLLKAGREAQDLVPLMACGGDDLHYAGAGIGEGARLVEDHGIGFGKGLQETAALDDHAVAGAFAHGGQHGQRGGEAQGAGIVHQQHGCRLHGIAGDEPDKARQGEGEGHGHVGHALELALDAGLEGLGFFDEAHHLLEAGAVAHVGGADDEVPLLHHRARIDGSALAAGHAQRLAGHAGLVDHGLAVLDDAVHRDGTTVTDHDQIAFTHISERHAGLHTIGQHPDGVHVEGQALGQAVHGAAARPVFQGLAQPQQQGQHRDGTEIAPQQGNPDGRGIQHVNIEFALKERGEALSQKGKGPHDTAGHAQLERQERTDEEEAQQGTETVGPHLVFFMGRQAAAGSVPFEAAFQFLGQGGQDTAVVEGAGILGGQGAEHILPGLRMPVEHEDAGHARVDPHTFHAVDGIQGVGQDLGLYLCHGAAGTRTQPSGPVGAAQFMNQKKAHARAPSSGLGIGSFGLALVSGLAGFGRQVFHIFLDGFHLAHDGVFHVHAAAHQVGGQGFEIELAAGDGNGAHDAQRQTTQEKETVFQTVVHACASVCTGKRIQRAIRAMFWHGPDSKKRMVRRREASWRRRR